MTAGIVQGAWTCGLIAGAFGKVTNLQKMVWVPWSRKRKKKTDAVWSRIRKAWGGKREAQQGFRGLGLKGVYAGTQDGSCPLANPPQGKDEGEQWVRR